MTIQEMHIAVELGLQKVASHQFDSFLPQEIDFYLNQAQLYVVKNRFDSKAGQALGFEDSKRRIADLHTLVDEVIMLPLLDGGETIPSTPPGEYLCAYPDDYLFYVYAESGLTRTSNPLVETKTYFPNELITNAQVRKVRQTPANQPYLRYPAILFKDLFIHVFCDQETTLEDQRLTYVRVPDEVNIGLDDDGDYSKDLERHCILPDHIHPEIVNMTIGMIKGDIQAPANPIRQEMEKEA